MVTNSGSNIFSQERKREVKERNRKKTTTCFLILKLIKAQLTYVLRLHYAKKKKNKKINKKLKSNKILLIIKNFTCFQLVPDRKLEEKVKNFFIYMNGFK